MTCSPSGRRLQARTAVRGESHAHSRHPLAPPSVRAADRFMQLLHAFRYPDARVLVVLRAAGSAVGRGLAPSTS
jgi:hypothetical protein